MLLISTIVTWDAYAARKIDRNLGGGATNVLETDITDPKFLMCEGAYRKTYQDTMHAAFHVVSHVLCLVDQQRDAVMLYLYILFPFNDTRLLARYSGADTT